MISTMPEKTITVEQLLVPVARAEPEGERITFELECGHLVGLALADAGGPENLPTALLCPVCAFGEATPTQPDHPVVPEEAPSLVDAILILLANGWDASPLSDLQDCHPHIDDRVQALFDRKLLENRRDPCDDVETYATAEGFEFIRAAVLAASTPQSEPEQPAVPEEDWPEVTVVRSINGETPGLPAAYVNEPPPISYRQHPEIWECRKFVPAPEKALLETIAGCLLDPGKFVGRESVPDIPEGQAEPPDDDTPYLPEALTSWQMRAIRVALGVEPAPTKEGQG